MGTAMRPRAYVFAAVGAALLLASTWAARQTELPSKDFTLIAGPWRVPVTVVEPTRSDRRSETRRAAIVLHGLAANRRVMRILGESLAADGDLRVYLIDLPGHGDNTDPFSFARAEECAAAVVEKLVRDGTIAMSQTAIVGHSMGGAIAIRLADRVPLAATVALSPAPMILPRRIPANLLVFGAQYDFPALKRQAEGLLYAAGGDRVASADFAQLRAFHLELVVRASHHSVLDDPNVAAQAAAWVTAALDPTTLRPAGLDGWTSGVRWRPSASVAAYTPKRGFVVAWTARVAPVAGAIGLLLFFPLALDIAPRESSGKVDEAKAPGLEPRASTQKLVSAELPTTNAAQTESVAPTPSRRLAVVEGAVFALLGVLILNFVVPARFLHMYSADYLASMLLIFGLVLIAFNSGDLNRAWRWKPRPLITAAVLGFAVMLALGAWLNWRLMDLWLNGARWWRFAALLPICLVFTFSEEVVLGPVQRGQRRAWRFTVFLLLRFELWCAAVFAFYGLGSGQVLIGVLAPALAGFSILERLGTDEIRVRTGSAVAAAVFGAILAAWFIAAVFPLT
jgi:pimeloyl-ACP methyl ester carboxylesterase